MLSRVFRIRPARRLDTVLKSAALDMGVQGDRGAIHLEVALNWFTGELPAKTRQEYPPQGVALVVHRATPADDRTFYVTAGPCEWLGVQCFPVYLPVVTAQDLALDLRDRGDDAVWEQLDQLYRERLG